MSAPRVTGPDGEPWTLPTAPRPGQSVADWLEANGRFLNTRCGKRGFCRGCRIETGSGEEIAACQTEVSFLKGGTFRVPATSLRDATLTGVTAFELDAEGHGPFSLPGGPGLALDIGTTTLAGALWTGNPPRCVALATRPNPQIRFGDNVVSRVQHSLDTPSGIDDLHRGLMDEGLRPLLGDLANAADLPPLDPARVTVAGNPVMLHTFARASLAGFATHPFHPEFLEERILPGSLLGVNCDLTLLPGPSPFVGSDVLGGAIANGFFTRGGARLLIDFGTNGEILLRDRTGRSWCTATAAGPAFEGGRLRCGAPAGPGVVGRLEMDPAGAWKIPAGRVPWRAMAGAAYVDFMAIGRKQGWLGSMGRFTGEGVTRARLTNVVSVSESDLAELLQAKAAIQAGWTTLLECAGLDVRDLDEVVVAGGFGYHLSPGHAVAIGLLPPVEPERVHLVGNASLAGASLALLGSGHLKGWRNHCRDMRVIELNQQACFEDHYINALILDGEAIPPES